MNSHVAAIDSGARLSKLTEEELAESFIRRNPTFCANINAYSEGYMRLLDRIKSVEGDKSECLIKDNSNKNIIETVDHGKSVQDRKQTVKKTEEVSKEGEEGYYDTKPEEIDHSLKKKHDE